MKRIGLLALAFLLLTAVLPAVAAPTSGDSVPADKSAEARKATEPAEKGPDCAEPLKGPDGKLPAGADGKPVERYDKRCTPEMIRVAKARKAKQAEYDVKKLEGIEGLGKASPEGAESDKTTPGTFEDLFGAREYRPAPEPEKRESGKAAKGDDGRA